MRSEHKSGFDEINAFTRWRKVWGFRAGQRKRIKAISHRKDRRRAKRRICGGDQ
jgi:hypothetical protein